MLKLSLLYYLGQGQQLMASAKETPAVLCCAVLCCAVLCCAVLRIVGFDDLTWSHMI